jgi:hypothetical protein
VFTFRVKHAHRFGSCEGILSISKAEVRFKSNEHDFVFDRAQIIDLKKTKIPFDIQVHRGVNLGVHSTVLSLHFRARGDNYNFVPVSNNEAELDRILYLIRAN